MNTIAKLLRALAIQDARLEGLYRRFCHPSGVEWASMRRERGDFYSMGDHCSIDPHAYFSVPAHVRLGNNVRLATCSVFCHDGAVNMINRAFGLRLDSVGKVDLRDNVYIGSGSILLPGVTIGPNAIVSAGSVVRSDVAEGDVVAGVPARRVGRLEFSVAMLKAKNQKFPWRHLIEQRASEFDPEMEPKLEQMRAEYYYGSQPPSQHAPGQTYGRLLARIRGRR
jgi:acetyltransferase-like isoleucine patch superfamily enzyme